MDGRSNLICPECNGCGWIIYEKRVELLPGKGLSEHPYTFGRKCPNCNGGTRAEIPQMQAKSKTPASFSDKTYKDFNWNIYQDEKHNVVDTEKTQKYVLSFIKDFQKWQQAGQGLYIQSKVKGSGKTFLASCLLNEIMKKYAVRSKFVPCIDLISIDQTANPRGTSEQEINPIGYIAKTPLIVIDDIGVKSQNSWIDEVLFKIVDTRLQQKLPTIFTSNIPIDELQYDERVTDRIYHMTQTVLLPEIKVRRMISGDKRNDFLKEIGL